MKTQTSKPTSDLMGSLIGLATFVGGIALLVVTFQLAYAMFSVPPEVAIAGRTKETIDPTVAGQSLVVIVVRVILLLVMSVVGSVIANRGIRLYVSCRSLGASHTEKPHKEPAAESPLDPEGT
ncbi:MAG: hypothetical protein M5U21_00115 [Fimbriimonadaceae bacterium]|nr:hypothetical protein [Fimbriimonadaceae bacterium]